VLTFFLSFVPFGPPVVWIGASIWLFATSHVGWGIFMTVYGAIAISGVDNIVKPIIISRGSKLPFVVMFIGVLGGIATFGFIGIFIGPTLLAVGFSLIQELLDQRRIASAIKSGSASEPTEPADTSSAAQTTTPQPPTPATDVLPTSGQDTSAG
jgi:predicted PurR-regulated permease PerM